jgi:hypothetical protein
MNSNRYRAFDRKEVGGIWHKLKTASGDDRERLAERLADYDPVELLNYVPGGDASLKGIARDLEWTRNDLRKAERREYSAKRELSYWHQCATDNERVARINRPRVTCANCRRQFFATRADAVTCSAKCRTALHRKRQRA